MVWLSILLIFFDDIQCLCNYFHKALWKWFPNTFKFWCFCDLFSSIFFSVCYWWNETQLRVLVFYSAIPNTYLQMIWSFLHRYSYDLWIMGVLFSFSISIIILLTSIFNTMINRTTNSKKFFLIFDFKGNTFGMPSLCVNLAIISL